MSGNYFHVLVCVYAYIYILSMSVAESQRPIAFIFAPTHSPADLFCAEVVFVEAHLYKEQEEPTPRRLGVSGCDRCVCNSTRHFHDSYLDMLSIINNSGRDVREIYLNLVFTSI